MELIIPLPYCHCIILAMMDDGRNLHCFLTYTHHCLKEWGMIRVEKVMVIFSLLSPSHHCMGFGGHVIRRKKKKLAPVSLADELGGGWGNKQDKAGTDFSLPPASDELGREKLRFIPSQGDKACGILHMRGGINPCFSYPLLKQRKR